MCYAPLLMGALHRRPFCFLFSVPRPSCALTFPSLAHSQVEHSRARMLAQFADDGSMPDEMRRPTQLHYMMFSLQGWYILARIAKRGGESVLFEGRYLHESP